MLINIQKRQAKKAEVGWTFLDPLTALEMVAELEEKSGKKVNWSKIGFS